VPHDLTTSMSGAGLSRPYTTTNTRCVTLPPGPSTRTRTSTSHMARQGGQDSLSADLSADQNLGGRCGHRSKGRGRLAPAATLAERTDVRQVPEDYITSCPAFRVPTHALEPSRRGSTQCLQPLGAAVPVTRPSRITVGQCDVPSTHGGAPVTLAAVKTQLIVSPARAAPPRKEALATSRVQPAF
jgi:hypothetical protein